MTISDVIEDQYFTKERTDESTHYFLRLEDVDCKDVALYEIVKNGLLRVGIPSVDFFNSTSKFLSRDISGSYLQSLINNQFAFNSTYHRKLTQLREIREFAILNRLNFNFIREAIDSWISRGQAQRFEFEYSSTYS